MEDLSKKKSAAIRPVLPKVILVDKDEYQLTGAKLRVDQFAAELAREEQKENDQDDEDDEDYDQDEDDDCDDGDGGGGGYDAAADDDVGGGGGEGVGDDDRDHDDDDHDDEKDGQDQDEKGESKEVEGDLSNEDNVTGNNEDTGVPSPNVVQTEDQQGKEVSVSEVPETSIRDMPNEVGEQVQSSNQNKPIPCEVCQSYKCCLDMSALEVLSSPLRAASVRCTCSRNKCCHNCFALDFSSSFSNHIFSHICRMVGFGKRISIMKDCA